MATRDEHTEAPEDETEDETEDEAEDQAPRQPERPKAGLFESQWTYLLLIPIIVVVWMVFAQSRKNAENADIEPDKATVAEDPLGDDDAPALAAALAKAWAGEPVDRSSLPPRLLEPGQPVYIAFRAGGERLYHLWREVDDVAAGGTMWDVLLQALEDGRRGLGSEREARVDRLELDLTHSYRTHDYLDAEQRRLLLDKDRHGRPHHMGVRGMQITYGDEVKRYAPSLMLARNRQNKKQLELARDQWNLSEEQFAVLDFKTFEADQVLVRLDTDPAEAVVMFRGNRVVDISEVTKQSTEALAQGMIDWLTTNTRDNGRLTYHYYPSTGNESKGNNMIRQWMATNAMVRWAHDRDDQEVFDLVETNIDYNVDHFFHFERDRKRISLAEGEVPGDDTLGVIEYRGKTKLGGVALAGMAMWLHPKRDKWIEEINGLRRMVDYLWHEDDGSFTSFYKGSDKEYWNFYPGEAMLWWATIYADTHDPEVLRKFKKSFYFFRDWHLDDDHRNPAFVPWMLQADYAMWSSLGPEEAEFKADLEDFMFEIADWLVGNMLQWTAEDGVVHPDEKGRFYAPKKRFGVPHASSTGVYLEGLIDAWQLARDVGNADRKEYYRVAMVRGIRSMMQLQFVDDVDMYYVAKRELVEGGIRTTVFDNAIRCDNVQHPMMGIIKILRMFEPHEFADAG